MRFFRYHPRIAFGLTVIGVLLLLAVAAALSRWLPHQARLIQPGANQQLELASPLVVQFNLPVSRRRLAPSIEPAVEGNWSWQGGLWGGRLARRLVFTADEPWQENQSYTIKLEGVSDIFGLQSPNRQELKFTTKALPMVAAVSVQKDAVDWPANQPIEITLDQPAAKIAEFYFRLEPETEAEIIANSEGNGYVIKPTKPLQQGVKYRLLIERESIIYSSATNAIVRRGQRAVVGEQFFTTQSPPSLADLSPQGSAVLPTTQEVKLVFAKAMQPSAVETAIKIEPSLKGRWQWQNDRELRFLVAEPLALATTYTLSLPQGTLAADQSFLEKDLKVSFTTVGALKVLSSSPAQSSGVSTTTAVKLNFDQPADRDSVVSSVSITPSATVNYSWQGNSLIISPSNAFGYNTRYTVRLAKGAKAVHGTPLAADYTKSFTTEEKVVVLPIAFDKQDYALSCEAASLKMALAYKGVRVSENEIMDRIGYDLSARVGNVWGDPDKVFVGSITGSQNSTGYGVHWGPIAQAARSWREAQAVSNLGVTDLTQAIEAGNPIVVWGTYGKAYYDPWQTADGRTIPAWKGEHARTVIGYRGSPDNPTAIILNDPIFGRQTWSIQSFKQDWARFNNSGVIVY